MSREALSISMEPSRTDAGDAQITKPVTKEQVTVVIPVLNEEEAIGQVIDEVKQQGYRKILVIDGYSTDRTAQIAREKGAIVVQQHGAGKAGALRTAFDLVNTPYMLVMDGDHTYDPKDAEKMLIHAGSYDEIIGVRSRKNIPLLHRIGNKIITYVFNLLLGTSLRDVCSGMYLLKTEAVRDLTLHSRGFEVEVEIASHVSSTGRITEVPIDYRERIGKQKLTTWKEGFHIITSIIRLARSYNPPFLLGTLFSLLAIPGIGILLWQLALRYFHGGAGWSIGWAWLGLLLLIIGIQGFTIATVTLLLKRVERRIMISLKGR